MSEVLNSDVGIYPITSQDKVQRIPPSIVEILDMTKRQTKLEMNCVSIGTVQTFYPEDQTADISINYKQVVNNEILDYPILLKVPVVVVGGGIGCITFPIKQGDQCLLFFCDRSLENWWISKSGKDAPPSSERAHDLSDAVALVGLSPSWGPVKNYQYQGVDILELRLGPDILLNLANNGNTTRQIGLFMGYNRDMSAWTYPGGYITLDTLGKTTILNYSPSGVPVSLKTSLDALCGSLNSLCTALTGWVDTRGDTPNAATVTAINAVKAATIAAQVLIDTVLA